MNRQNRQSNLLIALLSSIPLVGSICVPTVAQLTLAEAEKISAETGRTMFVVAGKKT